MPLDFVKPTPPTDDKRWKVVQATMRRNGNRHDALIETLHTVQESFGFLDDDSLRYVAAALRVPLSRVYGVATFYHFFRMKPAGKHTCVVCTGTACYIKGARRDPALDRAGPRHQARRATPTDTAFGADPRCLGSCGLATAVVPDGECSAGRAGPACWSARRSGGADGNR